MDLLHDLHLYSDIVPNHSGEEGMQTRSPSCCSENVVWRYSCYMPLCLEDRVTGSDLANISKYQYQ